MNRVKQNSKGNRYKYALMLALWFVAFITESKGLLFVTSSYPPYAVKINGNVQGLIPDLLETIYKEQPFEVLFVPWRRAELMIEGGEAFAAFPYGVTEKRKQTNWFSAPLIEISPTLFYLKSQFPKGFNWNQFEDLVGFQLVGTRGHSTNNIIENYGVTVHRVSSEVQAMQFIYAKRADFTLIDKRVGWDILHKHLPAHLDEFVSVSSDEFRWKYHLMVSTSYPNSKQHLEHFNQRLIEIKEADIYDDILRLYQQQQ